MAPNTRERRRRQQALAFGWPVPRGSRRIPQAPLLPPADCCTCERQASDGRLGQGRQGWGSPALHAADGQGCRENRKAGKYNELVRPKSATVRRLQCSPGRPVQARGPANQLNTLSGTICVRCNGLQARRKSPTLHLSICGVLDPHAALSPRSPLQLAADGGPCSCSGGRRAARGGEAC